MDDWQQRPATAMEFPDQDGNLILVIANQDFATDCGSRASLHRTIAVDCKRLPYSDCSSPTDDLALSELELTLSKAIGYSLYSHMADRLSH
jgi:hypothetical protein